MSQPELRSPRKTKNRRPSLGSTNARWQATSAEETHRGSWRSPTPKISDFEVAMVLKGDQEFVMSKPLKNDDPSQYRVQAQENSCIVGDGKIDGTHLGCAVDTDADVVSHADAALTLFAFTQTITTGANIQFDSATIRASGRDLTDDHHTL
jgi:hypothetical protein